MLFHPPCDAQILDSVVSSHSAGNTVHMHHPIQEQVEHCLCAVVGADLDRQNIARVAIYKAMDWKAVADEPCRLSANPVLLVRGKTGLTVLAVVMDQGKRARYMILAMLKSSRTKATWHTMHAEVGLSDPRNRDTVPHGA